MISRGDPFPAVPVSVVDSLGAVDGDSHSLLGAGRVLVFSVPGAFTPTCSNNHLPGYIEYADRIKACGIDRIFCLTVNDKHVVSAWAEASGATGIVDFIADGNAELTKALGIDKEMTRSGMGVRAIRSALIINGGIVEVVFTEDQPGQVTSSGAPAILESLGGAVA